MEKLGEMNRKKILKKRLKKTSILMNTSATITTGDRKKKRQLKRHRKPNLIFPFFSNFFFCFQKNIFRIPIKMI